MKNAAQRLKRSMWELGSPVPRAADISALCARHRVYRKPTGVPITQRIAEELRGRLRWWSHGAFRQNSEHYGAQYLAGRRAPPSL